MIVYSIHSPRFKPWAMDSSLTENGFNHFLNYIMLQNHIVSETHHTPAEKISFDGASFGLGCTCTLFQLQILKRKRLHNQFAMQIFLWPDCFDLSCTEDSILSLIRGILSLVAQTACIHNLLNECDISIQFSSFFKPFQRFRQLRIASLAHGLNRGLGTVP